MLAMLVALLLATVTQPAELKITPDPVMDFTVNDSSVVVPLEGTLVKEFFGKDSIGIEFTYVLTVTSPQLLLRDAMDVYNEMKTTPWPDSEIPAWTFTADVRNVTDSVFLRAWKVAWMAIIWGSSDSVFADVKIWLPGLMDRRLRDASVFRQLSVTTPFGELVVLYRPIFKSSTVLAPVQRE